MYCYKFQSVCERPKVRSFDAHVNRGFMYHCFLFILNYSFTVYIVYFLACFETRKTSFFVVFVFSVSPVIISNFSFLKKCNARKLKA